MGDEERLDRRAIDQSIQEHIRESKVCMENNRKEIQKMSEALFGEDGIVEWARDHIEAERERKELYKELKRKLIVKGALSAVGIAVFLLWYGFTTWLKTGGTAQ